ncbi:MAG TPA: hypothetical protein VIK13_00955 [Candidatus Limnocylindrales bacterium]
MVEKGDKDGGTREFRHHLLFAATVAVALAVLIARRPETITRAGFYAEDGRVFFLGTWFGSPLDVLLRPYNGYLHLVPRTVGLLERLVPIQSAPALGNFIALLIVALIAGFLASDRLAPLLPDRRARLAAAVGFLLLPASQETLGSITFIQAYLVVFLVAVGFASTPRTRTWRAVETLAVAVSALSTPIAIMLVPLHWVRVRRFGRAALGPAIALTAAAAVQLAVLAASRPPAVAPADLLLFAQASILHLVVEPFGGATWTRLTIDAALPGWVGITAAIVIVGLFAISLTAIDRRVALALLGTTWAVGVLGIVRSSDASGWLLDPFLLQRYFVPAGWAAVVIMASGLFARSTAIRRAALALAVCFVAGATADLRLPARPDLGWAAASRCIGGPTPCVVPVFPPDTFSIHWPGPGGPYVQGDWTN